MQKPIQRLGLSDWHSRVNQIRNVADVRRSDAFNLRHTCRTLRNESQIESNWINNESNDALSGRIAELNRWRTTIEKTFERICQEVRLLREETASTERELESITTPLTVVTECLSMRDSRLGSELTYDDADTELKKELAVVENNQRLLREQCEFAWEKLTRLEDVQAKIGLELENKAKAEAIDVAQLDLNKFSPDISFKTDPTNHPKDSCSYKSWLLATKNLKQLAENELSDTYAIRESLFVCREKARNLLYSQQDKSEHAIRKRIFETQRARNELEWQKLKMGEEIERTLGEIKTLEQALREKSDALKLAETRLENRAQRSGTEQCLDEAYDKLCAEVTKLHDIIRTIQDNIYAAKTNSKLLEEHSQTIDVDLKNKEHSLMTDIRAMDLRGRLKSGEFAKEKHSPSQQTERNITLTKMEDEIPKS